MGRRIKIAFFYLPMAAALAVAIFFGKALRNENVFVILHKNDYVFLVEMTIARKYNICYNKFKHDT